MLFRGALSRSVMIRFAGLRGSTAKCSVPASFSYGPAAAKLRPASTSARDFTSIRTTSAHAGAANRSSAANRLFAVMLAPRARQETTT